MIRQRYLDLDKANARIEELQAERDLLISLLPKCEEGYDEGCDRPATRCHPTAAWGDFVLRCDLHPGRQENDMGDNAYDLRQAEFVRSSTE